MTIKQAMRYLTIKQVTGGLTVGRREDGPEAKLRPELKNLPQVWGLVCRSFVLGVRSRVGPLVPIGLPCRSSPRAESVQGYLAYKKISPT